MKLKVPTFNNFQKSVKHDITHHLNKNNIFLNLFNYLNYLII
jgi:hypothetical protein